ncbi:cell death-inducing p53-target protein 1-like isoform X1 [Argiope bruennichi]|uniref:cell death-inducing p53-target protein 1-like isoform X1 n=1 Tax=Argiope bruennichi TaxID=94029 RepID=UPI002493F47E|nr:cell death-inducing p53-target protein 1-like isoform X1 [Argiope bruennichi]
MAPQRQRSVLKKVGTPYRFKVRPVTVVQHPLFGPDPVVTICTSCGKEVTTETSRHTSACSYITCILSIFVCFPCFWVPLVCPWFLDTIHTCPNCKDTMGIYSRFN